MKRVYSDLDKIKQYRPLPSGLTIADSGIAGQGLFTTRRLVMGTTLGISHYRIDGEYEDDYEIMTILELSDSKLTLEGGDGDILYFNAL